jgi:hypothetical protein
MGERKRTASLFMRGIMFDPGAGTTSAVDTTDESDCTTGPGHARLKVLRGLVARPERIQR